MRGLTFDFNNKSNVQRNCEMKRFEKFKLKHETYVWGTNLSNTFFKFQIQFLKFFNVNVVPDIRHFIEIICQNLIFTRGVSLQDSTVFASNYAFLWNSVQILNFLKFQHFVETSWIFQIFDLKITLIFMTAEIVK